MEKQGGGAMNFLNNCNCLLAGLIAFAVILAIGLAHGYAILQWTSISWLGAIVIVVCAVFCLRCRQIEDKKESI